MPVDEDDEAFDGLEAEVPDDFTYHSEDHSEDDEE